MLNKIFLLIISLPVILFVVFIIYLSPISTVIDFSFENNITGTIFDCETKEPVGGAQVSMSGTGWGFRQNQLVWDKSYYSTAITDTQGKYNLNYNIGTTFSTKKDGYLMALDYSGKSNRNVGILKNSKNLDENSVSTYGCVLSTECYKTKTINGVQHSWNSCTSPQLEPK